MAASSSDSITLSDKIILFSHGAGAGIQSDHCQRWISLLKDIAPVHTIEYSYMKSGRRRPPPPIKTLVIEQVQRYRELRDEFPNAKIIMIGRSMGSRVACHASLEKSVDVSAIICLSYPLIASSAKKTRRDEVLKLMQTPVMFVAGSKDPMCPIKDLQTLLKTLHCQTVVHVMESAGHDLMIRPRNQQKDAESDCILAIKKFLQNVV